MKSKKNIILYSLFFLLLSCNQNQYGALTAAKNLVSLPYSSVKNFFSNRRYNDIRENSETTSPEETQDINMISCVQRQADSSPTHPLELYGDIMNQTRELVCSCKPWGSCFKNTCSCSTLCPNNFDIFKKHPYEESTADLSTLENSLSFRNAESMELSTIEGTNGYCWGHASITSKFNRLGFFDDSDTEMKDNLDKAPGSSERDQAIRYYKEVIDDIVDNKVRNIPGFKNLYEFSSHPELETYLSDKVAKSWANRAMSVQGLSTALRDKPMSMEDSKDFFNDVKEKLDDNQQPQIVFTKSDSKFTTHAVLVSDYILEDDKMTLCLRDNNNPPYLNQDCRSKMYISYTGAVIYNQWGEIGRAEVAHNDNPDALEQFDALREHCLETKFCSAQ